MNYWDLFFFFYFTLWSFTVHFQLYWPSKQDVQQCKGCSCTGGSVSVDSDAGATLSCSLPGLFPCSSDVRKGEDTFQHWQVFTFRLRMQSKLYQLVLILLWSVQTSLVSKGGVVLGADLFTWSPPSAHLLSSPLLWWNSSTLHDVVFLTCQNTICDFFFFFFFRCVVVSCYAQQMSHPLGCTPSVGQVVWIMWCWVNYPAWIICYRLSQVSSLLRITWVDPLVVGTPCACPPRSCSYTRTFPPSEAFFHARRGAAAWSSACLCISMFFWSLLCFRTLVPLLRESAGDTVRVTESSAIHSK